MLKSRQVGQTNTIECTDLFATHMDQNRSSPSAHTLHTYKDFQHKEKRKKERKKGKTMPCKQQASNVVLLTGITSSQWKALPSIIIWCWHNMDA